MPVSLESFVRFTCFNFCLKALDSYFHPITTAGASDSYMRHNSAAAGSYRQPWILFLICCILYIFVFVSIVMREIKPFCNSPDILRFFARYFRFLPVIFLSAIQLFIRHFPWIYGWTNGFQEALSTWKVWIYRPWWISI